MCSAGKYARKYVPWADFTNVPADVSLPFDRFNARGDYASLPTVSFVIPNLDNDMHDGSIAQADRWLQADLSRYANWAKANHSLLIVTWDEDDNGADSHIPTVFYGAHVPVARMAARSTTTACCPHSKSSMGCPKPDLPRCSRRYPASGFSNAVALAAFSKKRSFCRCPGSFANA